MTDAPSTSTRIRAGFHHLRVAAVDRLCDDAAAVTFDVPDELRAGYAFRAGQTLTLRRTVDGRDERRSYSLCSPEGARPRIGVRLVPGGLFSSWLVRDLEPGDTVDVGTPTGSFSPDDAPTGHHVLVAAGSGITPLLSIATTLLRSPDAGVTLLYGNRRTDTVMFADELADLKDRYPTRLELIHVLSREPRQVELFSGRLDPPRLAALVDLIGGADTVDHWWLCGPRPLVTAAQDLLAALGVDPAAVHRELFYAGDDAPPAPARADGGPEGPTAEVTVVLDGRSTTVAVARSEAVLDGAQRTRPDLPFACKGGVCGTCRARVTEGRVEMRRNFALEPGEVDAGFVLTCQSRPVTDRVTVDYDT